MSERSERTIDIASERIEGTMDIVGERSERSLDIARDELRRELRALEREQGEAMPRWRTALMRLLVDDRRTPTGTKAELLLGGFDRRRFLALGGGAALAGVALGACGEDDENPALSGATTTTTEGGGDTAEEEEGVEGTEDDLVVASTAVSLELFAVDVYADAIDRAEDLLLPPDLVDAARVFRDQHEQHAEAFNDAVVELGGRAVAEPNEQLAGDFASAIEGLSTEADVVRLAYDLELVAAQTYQGVGVGRLSTPELRQTAMSVGGVEARHAALIAMFLDELDPNPYAFQPLERAIPESYFVG